MVLSIQNPPNPRNGNFSRSSNQLLNLLSESDRQNIVSQSSLIFLPQKKTLHKPQELIEKVYFPLEGIISLVNTSEAGLISASATVGNEGMVGIAAFLGGHFLDSSAIVLIDCFVLSVDVEILKHEFVNGGNLQRILLLYTQALFSQVSQNVFCSCHHTLEQRLARWLLSYSDRLSSRQLLLTQETLADLLGVKRSSLSIVASALRQRNLIDYSRGRIIIQNPIALRKVACNCDRLISAEYYRLMGL